MVARYLPPYATLARTLHSVRCTIALALYARAKDLNWREPLTFVRALQVSERYLRWSVSNAELTSAGALRQLEGRLGVCLVLRSRYEDLPVDDLREAGDRILSSLSNGSALVGHDAYYAESQIRLFDQVGDAEILMQFEEWCDSVEATGSAQLPAVRAEAWLRLGDEARTVQAAAICWSRAVQHSQSVPADDGFAATRARRAWTC